MQIQSEVIAPVVNAVQPTSPTERNWILEIAKSTGVFNAEELDTVVELLADYYRDADTTGYYFLSYRDGDQVLGFATWGPRSLAENAYDLYWIAVHPSAQRRGVAQALLAEVEAQIKTRGGGWVWIETSGTDHYAAARAFYARSGYRRLAMLDDFYRSGDSLHIFLKQV